MLCVLELGYDCVETIDAEILVQLHGDLLKIRTIESNRFFQNANSRHTHGLTDYQI